jgi:hypothetical protein
MASNYKVAIGHGIDLVDLDLIVPQPLFPVVRPTQRTHGTSGQVHDQGLWVPLNWNTIEDVDQYQDLLDQFGLASAETGLVTLYVRNGYLTMTRYNGKAVRPMFGDDADFNNYFIRGVTIIVKELEAI